MKPTNRSNRSLVKTTLRSAFIAAACSAALTGVAQAETTLSFYLGGNGSPDSVVDYDLNLGDGPQSTLVSWDGEVFKMPPYFGFRAIWWLDARPNWGFGIDNNHAKVAADPLPAGLSQLEFTDGINIVTANVHYRFQNDSRYTPYLGVGLGITIPHVEVSNTAGTSVTSEYQFGGPAVQAIAGVNFAINDRWSVFGEAKIAYVEISGDLNGGGWVKSNIISNQIAFGVSYTFN